jgi:hypothetical protein
MQNKNQTNREIINWALFTGALICSWVTMVFFFTIPIGLIIWTICAVILFVRKTSLKWYLLIFSGWTVISSYSFIRGTTDYFSGKASIIGVGLPGPEFYNLDPEYRVWHRTSGCIVVGIEIFTHNPRNFATQLCTRAFGYQKGVYTGFYPDEKQTKEIILNKSDTVSFTRKDLEFYFKFNNVDYKLVNSWQREIQELDSCSSALVAFEKDELIIFKPLISGNETVTYLADKKNGEVFARYHEFRKEYGG